MLSYGVIIFHARCIKKLTIISLQLPPRGWQADSFFAALLSPFHAEWQKEARTKKGDVMVLETNDFY